MEINATQEKLLTERGVIVLPETIEHDTFEMALALLMLAETEWKDKPIRLFCTGSGGNAHAALALAV
jgi:ATP-dependent protease ClpP protease subunit